MKKVIVFLILNVVMDYSSCQYKSIYSPESSRFNLSENNTLPSIQYYLSDNISKNTINDSTLRVGDAEIVDLDFFSSATKSRSTNSVVVYRLKIKVKNAVGIGIDFSDFHIPMHGKLFAYNEDKSVLLGAYTSSNNKDHSRFSIQPIIGESIILEYNQPDTIKELAVLRIERIAKLFHPIFSRDTKSSTKRATCYTDVHCETGFEVERSVMRWYFYDDNENGYYICSCFLINQDVDSDDLNPYVLTAKHCGKDADLTTAKFYFNFQSPECDGSSGNKDNYTLTGGQHISDNTLTDMYLLELDDFPPPDYNVYLAGWDRSSYSSLSGDALGIHHPEGEEKSISLGSFKSNTNPNFWRISYDVNDTPTLPGSSGSPIFDDDNDLAVGWDSYSLSGCSNTDGITSYGKLKVAWSGLFSTSRLKDWLDPDDNDETSLSGTDPCFTDLVIEDTYLYSASARYQPENEVKIQAGSSLETSGTVVIKYNAEYVFTAGDNILLNPGFKVESGGIFSAIIQACD